MTLTVTGGSRLDSLTPGIASFMAGMLDEGASTRDALSLQSELATSAPTSLPPPTGTASPSASRFRSGTCRPPALMSDVVIRPAFRAEEVRRQRDLRLTSLPQARDQPNAVASLAFNQGGHHATHPYSRNANGDSVTVASYDSALVRRFYNAALRPEQATLFIVGDVDGARIGALLTQHFGARRSTGTAAALPAAPVTPAHPATTSVWLVRQTRSGASVIMIGWPGVDRTSPDFAALQVMNTLLGGSFTSRLNMNLRETKGYSYGASSGFTYRWCRARSRRHRRCAPTSPTARWWRSSRKFGAFAMRWCRRKNSIAPSRTTTGNSGQPRVDLAGGRANGAARDVRPDAR